MTNQGGTGGGVGGAFGAGTIFTYNLSTGQENVAYSFQNTPDGARPSASLLLSGSNLVGITGTGGNGGMTGYVGLGTIFSFNPATSTESVLWNFRTSTRDSAFPVGLIQSAANPDFYYGAGDEGGNLYTNGAPGTVFAYSAATNSMSILHNFGATGDGQYPGAAPVQSGSMLYGTTTQGGIIAPGPFNEGLGTIYSLNLNTNKETVLHEFAGGPADGSYPDSPLNILGESLYGITASGDSKGDGAIFSYNLITNVYTVIHNFSQSGIYQPSYGAMVQSGNVLYGTAFNDGTFNDGSIFSIDTTTNTYTTLFSFDGADGQFPDTNLYLNGSTLYGGTLLGGSANQGVLFSLTIPEPSSWALMAMSIAFLSGRHRDRLEAFSSPQTANKT
jgi:uncharacterized repeat protein (TIGR03803 family)